MAGILSPQAGIVKNSYAAYKPNPYEDSKPSADNLKKSEASTKTKTFTLDVLTLNTYLLTTPIPLGQKIPERSARISKSIQSHDIVSLQEAFFNGSKKIAEDNKKEYPYQNRQTKEKSITNSGLTTLSRYKITERDFKPFSFSAGTDALAHKGILFTRLQAPGFGYIDVYNTHYQAGHGFDDKKWYTPLYKLLPNYTDKISKNDIKMVSNMDFERFFQKHDKGYTSIFMGDFNFSEDSDLYADLVKRLNLKDSFRVKNPDDPGYSSDGVLNPYKHDNNRSRIDFIFYRPGKNQQVDVLGSRLSHTKPINGMFVSDHFGVNSKLKITETE
jgi:endonuclease/exonuclease/phosphatase family metal-dependent hydrolase